MIDRIQDYLSQQDWHDVELNHLIKGLCAFADAYDVPLMLGVFGGHLAEWPFLQYSIGAACERHRLATWASMKLVDSNEIPPLPLLSLLKDMRKQREAMEKFFEINIAFDAVDLGSHKTHQARDRCRIHAVRKGRRTRVARRFDLVTIDPSSNN